MTFNIIEQIALIVLTVAGAGYFVYELFRRIQIIKAGKPDCGHEATGTKVGRFISEVIFQSKVIKDRPIVGILHALVFWGFLAYIGVTVNHFLKPFGLDYLHGGIGELYILFVQIFSVLVLIGILLLALRRFFMTPDYFEKGKISYTSGVVAILITALMMTFLIEPTFVEGSMSAKVNWWIHAMSIVAFLVVVPNSKHFHLVIGPFDLVNKRDKFGFQQGLNLEELDEDSVLGISKPEHLSSESRMDAFSCVECGRCTEMCPANGSDKILDPRSIIHNFEKELLAGSEEDIFEKGVINSEAVWQCVTCGACESICPLGVEHLPVIQLLRRNLTLEQGEIPQQMQNCYKSLQIKQNVWNIDSAERAEKIEELGLPVHEKGQMLIWTSCFFLTEEFRPKVVDFINLLKKAGVEAGVSPLEICCGDPGRKTGGEDLFQEMAMENIEWMKEAEVKTIVSQCPHCLQTILDGYSQVDPEFKVEVIHHSQLLAQLLQEGKLESTSNGNGKITVHDPCYVSRWGIGDMDGIRDITKAHNKALKELDRCKEKSFCCGSGGGAHHFFEDEDMKRIDTERVKQIVASGAEEVVTACPFCYNMVAEGLKQEESEMKVHDLTSLLK